ncbi:hypothetical protein [Pelagovum pacificum]|uniref:Uncharacterized protein n=1 Tax=Pelagovum pacificum TaxID=2588711 RepID=A0A5C5GGL4_9RHOB|nr:hypothetical protein [Pelagovum pacificum]QQA44201.1 hypothetical protein I8N54_06375 [Pelagovum pacificum]TNY32676.1 hypothetical protein FHY64_05190 [Pelagovum pacificum]
MRLALALILAPGLALAQGEQCLLTEGEQALTLAPVDLGDGMVAQEFLPGAIDGIPDGVVDFAHCESGGHIVVAMPENDQGNRPSAEMVIGIMEDAMANEELVPAQVLADGYTRAGAPAQVRQSTTETCGCSVFYPDAVGEKTPWEELG